MANAHVALPERVASSPWYSRTVVRARELHNNDVVLDRNVSCGACTVIENRAFKNGRYVIFGCCGGQRLKPDALVAVAAPRQAPVTLEEAPLRHPACRCRWDD